MAAHSSSLLLYILPALQAMLNATHISLLAVQTCTNAYAGRLGLRAALHSPQGPRVYVPCKAPSMLEPSYAELYHKIQCNCNEISTPHLLLAQTSKPRPSAISPLEMMNDYASLTSILGTLPMRPAIELKWIASVAQRPST